MGLPQEHRTVVPDGDQGDGLDGIALGVERDLAGHDPQIRPGLLFGGLDITGQRPSHIVRSGVARTFPRAT